MNIGYCTTCHTLNCPTPTIRGKQGVNCSHWSPEHEQLEVDEHWPCPGCFAITTSDYKGQHDMYCEQCHEKIPEKPSATHVLQGLYPNFEWVEASDALRVILNYKCTCCGYEFPANQRMDDEHIKHSPCCESEVNFIDEVKG